MKRARKQGRKKESKKHRSRETNKQRKKQRKKEKKKREKACDTTPQPPILPLPFAALEDKNYLKPCSSNALSYDVHAPVFLGDVLVMYTLHWT